MSEHLHGAPLPVNRTDRRKLAAERTIRTIQRHGNGYTSAGAALRSAAERNFGSWAKACEAAGIEPPKRGRPALDTTTAAS